MILLSVDKYLKTNTFQWHSFLFSLMFRLWSSAYFFFASKFIGIQFLFLSFSNHFRSPYTFIPHTFCGAAHFLFITFSFKKKTFSFRLWIIPRIMIRHNNNKFRNRFSISLFSMFYQIKITKNDSTISYPFEGYHIDF